jgi:hypothetical protein
VENSSFDHHAIFTIKGLKLDLDLFATRCRKILAHEICSNRQLAMTPIDQNCELHCRRPAQFAKRIKGCPDGSSRKENVIDQNDISSFNSSRRNFGSMKRSWRSEAKIITMKRDIEGPKAHLLAFNGCDLGVDTLSENHTARGNSKKQERVCALIAFQDFMRNTTYSARYLIARQNGTRHLLLLGRLTGRSLKGWQSLTYLGNVAARPEIRAKRPLMNFADFSVESNSARLTASLMATE